jgi:diadenosine tetraphosphate (Ap4A) HIT family hydrolase
MSCDLCGRIEAAPPDAVVLADDQFVVFQVGDVPGWITVATRRHAEGMEGLDEVEAARLGEVLRRVTAALRSATGADRVHAVYLGEHARHCHVGLFPRRPEQPSLFGNEALMAEMRSLGDGAAAGTVRGALRDALAG